MMQHGGKTYLKGKDGITYLKGKDGQTYAKGKDVHAAITAAFGAIEGEGEDMLNFLEDGLEDVGKAIAEAEAEVAKGARPATRENVREGKMMERADGSLVMNKGGKILIKPSKEQQKAMKGAKMAKMEQMMMMKGKGPVVNYDPNPEDYLDFLDETNVKAIPDKPLDTAILEQEAVPEGVLPVTDPRAKTPIRPANPAGTDGRAGPENDASSSSQQPPIAGLLPDGRPGTPRVTTTTASGAPLPEPKADDRPPMTPATAAMNVVSAADPMNLSPAKGKGKKAALSAKDFMPDSANGKAQNNSVIRNPLRRGRNKNADPTKGTAVAYTTKGGLRKGPIDLKEDENLLDFKDEVDMDSILQEVQTEQSAAGQGAESKSSGEAGSKNRSRNATPQRGKGKGKGSGGKGEGKEGKGKAFAKDGKGKGPIAK
jgi:hypothetical protein